mgnify:CR=1 FL=1
MESLSVVKSTKSESCSEGVHNEGIEVEGKLVAVSVKEVLCNIQS